jgi:hypothetical protein
MLLQFPFLLTNVVLLPTAGLPVSLSFRNVTPLRLASHCCIHIRTGVREHCVTAGQEVGLCRLNVKVYSREGK